MEKRKLGNSSLEVAPWALGGNVFGWTVDEPASFRLLDAFVDAGFNLVDTADVYSRWKPGNKGGESETIIGKWLKYSGKRNRIVLATKVGSEMGPDKKGLTKKYILQAVEDSLKRLQTDHIDLYQTHFDDENTPVEETLSAYAALVKQGKVRYIGASNMSPERLLESLQVSREMGYPVYQTLQPLYNLYDREDYETKYENICVQNNIAVIPYYGLASGFLTWKYHSEADLSKSPRGQGVKKYMNDRGFRIIKTLEEIAIEYGDTPAGIALAWLASRPGVAAPIASATNSEQLTELALGVQTKLDADSLERLDRASSSTSRNIVYN